MSTVPMYRRINGVVRWLEGESRQDAVGMGVFAARLALKYVPQGEDLPRLLIEAVERWIENPDHKAESEVHALARECASRAAVCGSQAMATAALAADVGVFVPPNLLDLVFRLAMSAAPTAEEAVQIGEAIVCRWKERFVDGES